MSKRTYIKFDIDPVVKEEFKSKCLSLGLDMAGFLRGKVYDFNSLVEE